MTLQARNDAAVRVATTRVVASLRRCDDAVALLRWQVEPMGCSAAMAGRVDDYAALQRWRASPTTTQFYSDGMPGQRLCCSVSMAHRADGYVAL